MKLKGNIDHKECVKMRFRFQTSSFCVFLFIFVLEVLIALFVHDSIIRPFGGDLLVVILIYYFVKSFLHIDYRYLTIVVLTFAYMVEIGQYFNLVDALGLRDNRIMRIVIGSSFSWGDLVAYTLGAMTCYLVEFRRVKNHTKDEI